MKMKKWLSYLVSLMNLSYGLLFGYWFWMEWSRLRSVTMFQQQGGKIDASFVADMVANVTSRDQLFNYLKDALPILLILTVVYIGYFKISAIKSLFLYLSPLWTSAVAMLPFVLLPYATGEYLGYGNSYLYLLAVGNRWKWILLCGALLILAFQMPAKLKKVDG